jgi:hypothetical protein
VTTRPPPDGVPLSRGIILHSLTATVRATWGEPGVADVKAHLPDDVAADTGPGFVPLRWYPTTHLVAWHRAIFEGPARLDERVFAECIGRSLDVSMGIIRRTFMRLLTPDSLVEGAAKVWRDFHTTGIVTVERHGPGQVTMTVADHPFVGNALSRKVVAIMSRHLAERSRAKGVRETHGLDAAGRLVVSVTWRT